MGTGTHSPSILLADSLGYDPRDQDVSCVPTVLACVGHRGNVASGIMTGGVLITAVVPALYGMMLAGQQRVAAYAQASEWLKGGHLNDIGVRLPRCPEWAG